MLFECEPGKRQRRRLSAGLALWVICPLSLWMIGARVAYGQERASIEGVVRTGRGEAIPFGVTVRLETDEGMVAQQPLNSEGEFEFDYLPKRFFRLIVTGDGFQTSERDLDLAHGPDRVHVNIFLSPESKTKTNSEALPALTDLNAPKHARREYAKGAQALERKDLAQARAHYEKAISEYPCYARAQTDLALVLAGQHEIPPAEAALRKAIQCDAGFLDAYAELSELLSREKRFTESGTVLEQGLRRSPSTWQFYYELGVAHYGMGQYTSAESDYLKVVAVNPKPPSKLHVKLADVYLKQAAYDKAYAQMQEYLRLEPAGPFAAKVKSIMQSLESSGMVHAAQSQAAQPSSPRP